MLMPLLQKVWAPKQILSPNFVYDGVATLAAETETGQRLRQNSPFAGILSPDEVWEIKLRHRHATSAA